MRGDRREGIKIVQHRDHAKVDVENLVGHKLRPFPLQVQHFHHKRLRRHPSRLRLAHRKHPSDSIQRLQKTLLDLNNPMVQRAKNRVGCYVIMDEMPRAMDVFTANLRFRGYF